MRNLRGMVQDKECFCKILRKVQAGFKKVRARLQAEVQRKVLQEHTREACGNKGKVCGWNSRWDGGKHG